MSTLVLNAYSSAYPDITNRIRASIFLQSDPLAIIASQIDSTIGHPIRIWSFPGLPRNNYGFSLDEIDGSDNPINNLAYFDVVPGEVDGELIRNDEQVMVDTTPGLVAGNTSAVFDGSLVSGGTVAIVFQGNTNASHAAFTLSGIPFTGDMVQVDWSTNPNPTDPPNDYSVTSTAMAGWSLDDLITDLYNQMVALDVNTTLFSTGGNNGVRVHGFSTASINVTLTSTPGAVKPDYRGWDIVIDEMTGRDILATDYDYTWDKVTGTFTLLLSGDVFQSGQRYNIHFDSIVNPQGNSYPTVTDFNINLIVTDTTLNQSFFGDKLIVEPNDVYIEVTLPPILNVAKGRKLMVEVGGSSPVCAKFLSQDATINFLRGNIYAYPGECFSIYRYDRAGVSEWRVCDDEGNFKTVGQSVGDDSIQSNVFNKKLMDGSIESTSKYARLYNEIVLNLPLTQVVDFSAWTVGNNKYFFSRDNGSGQFHFPDRRGVFEKNNSGGKAGDFQAAQVGQFTDTIVIPKENTSIGEAGTGNFTTGSGINEPTDMNGVTITFNTGKENLVVNILINKYCLI